MNKKETNAWLKAELERNKGKLESSAAYVGLFGKDYAEEPLVALQLGVCMLLDKPIIIIAIDGTEVSENLKKVARLVEYVKSGDDAGLEQAVVKVNKIVEEFTRGMIH